MTEEIDWQEMRDNPGALAAFMLRLVDESPDRLAIIEVPHAAVRTDDELPAIDAIFIREYDRAKADRPNLAVKLTPGDADHPNAALLVAVHEHKWVGGRCVNGCSDTRPAMTDPRRQPADFLEEAREIRSGWEHRDDEAINPAKADQMRAASRDARRIMGEAPNLDVIDVTEMGEREIALFLAITAAVARRDIRSRHSADSPRPDLVDLYAGGRPGHCDVCDARAHRLEEMHAQYGPYIFRARICVRCRKFGPDTTADS